MRPRASPTTAGSALGAVVLGVVLGLGVPASGGPPAESARTALDRALAPDARAELAWLEHLGWRVAFDPAAREPSVRGGAPASRADLAAAQAAGDLLLSVPASLSPEATARFSASLPALADGADSRCAWQFRVQEAVLRATARLSAAAKKGDYVFPKILSINSPFFTLDPPEPEWAKKGDLWLPTVAPSAAVAAFYSKKAVAECFVAQTVATLATQYELYSPADFDAAFTALDLGIGWVKPYYQTPFGHSMDHDEEHPWKMLLVRDDQLEEDPGAVLARLGPRAFAAATGILMDQGGSERSNENFTIVSVSDAACAQMRDGGGFPVVARLSQQVLDLDAGTRCAFATAAEIDPLKAAMARVLAQPVMTGLRLYIHPYGVLPIGEFVDKKIRKDRTAIRVVPYVGGREDAYFRRYHEAFLARSKREHAAHASPGTSGGGAVPASAPVPPPAPPSAPASPSPSPAPPLLPPAGLPPPLHRH